MKEVTKKFETILCNLGDEDRQERKVADKQVEKDNKEKGVGEEGYVHEEGCVEIEECVKSGVLAHSKRWRRVDRKGSKTSGIAVLLIGSKCGPGTEMEQELTSMEIDREVKPMRIALVTEAFEERVAGPTDRALGEQ